MKKILIITMLAITGLFFAFKTVDSQEWVLDKQHAKLSFSVSHFMVSDVEGSFKNFEATIVTTKNDFSDAIVTMAAEAGSINTDNTMRDNDLKSASYFDAAKYPLLIFKSKTFEKIDDQNYKVTGEMTIHGITKTVELNAFARMGTNSMTKKEIAGFKVTGTIKRLDFGVGVKSPVTMIGDDVTIVANVEFGKK